jgi:hypothetical protein
MGKEIKPPVNVLEMAGINSISNPQVAVTCHLRVANFHRFNNLNA